MNLIHCQPKVGEGFFFGDTFALITNVGNDFEGDFPRSRGKTVTEDSAAEKAGFTVVVRARLRHWAVGIIGRQ